MTSTHNTRAAARRLATTSGRVLVAAVAVTTIVAAGSVATSARFTDSVTVSFPTVRAFQMDPARPTLTLVDESATGVSFSWPTRQYATGYEFQARINDGAWGVVQSAAAPTGTVAAAGGSKVEVQARDTAPNNVTAWSNVVVGYTTPVAPDTSSATSTTTTSGATFTWAPVAYTDHYETEYRINGGAWSAVQAAANPTVAVTAAAGDMVEVQVRVVGTHGATGPWSAPITAYLVPPAPAPVAASSTTSTVTFSWPLVQHAASYTYSSRVDGGAVSDPVTTTNPTATITAAAGDTVEVQVLATNPSGQNSDPSPWAPGYLLTDAPSVTPGTTTATTADFTWTPVAGADHYEVQSRSNGGAWSASTSVAATSTTITGSNAAKLDAQVRAVNHSGQAGAWSAAATGYLVPPAPTVAANNAGASQSSVGFSWTTVPNTLRYEFQYRVNGGAWSATTDNGSATSWTGSPGANAKLEIQVRAVNQAGAPGPWSTIPAGYTLNSAPHVASSGITTTQATLSWSASGANTAKYNWYFGGGSQNGGTATSYTAGGTPGQVIGFNVCAVNPAGVQGACSPGSVTLAVPNPVLGSGSAQGTYSGRSQYQLRLSVQEVSYNLATNQSVVNWQLVIVESSHNGSYNNQHVGAWSANIGGNGYSGGHDTDMRSVTSITLATGSNTFTHNPDGSLTIGVSASDNAGAPFGSASAAFNVTLSDLR